MARERARERARVVRVLDDGALSGSMETAREGGLGAEDVAREGPRLGVLASGTPAGEGALDRDLPRFLMLVVSAEGKEIGRAADSS